MKTLIVRPLSPLAIVLAALGLIAATTIYCLAYTALSGDREPVIEGIVWAILNVLPWFLAFEIGKRIERFWQAAGIVGLTAALAVAVQLVTAGGDPGFELLRRLPGALAVLALLAIGRAFEIRAPAATPTAAERDDQAPDPVQELPLLPRQIEWIAAAGNYVELHGPDGPVIHRSSLSRVGKMLRPHGFVRIHRSTLVRRDLISDVNGDSLMLASGRELKTGARYRAAIAD